MLQFIPSLYTVLTYRDAGVNVERGNQLVARIRDAVTRTHGPEVRSAYGGFAAIAEIPSGYEKPLLVAGTDGAGTKLELLMQHDRHEAGGQDLVAMSVNDVLVYGAKPSYFLDYYATAALDTEVAARVIKGVARACELAQCALVGGETAEMPGFYTDSKYDLAGFCIGFVEASQMIDPRNVSAGDVVIGLESSGPHANGYSLIRKILESSVPPHAVLEQLLTPTEIYSQAILAVANQVNGVANITGGGFIENVPRAFKPALGAQIDLNAWHRHECFPWLQQQAKINELEMMKTFNCGIGMTLFVPPENVDSVLNRLSELTRGSHVIGEVRERHDKRKTSGSLWCAKDSCEVF